LVDECGVGLGEATSASSPPSLENGGTEQPIPYTNLKIIKKLKKKVSFELPLDLPSHAKSTSMVEILDIEILVDRLQNWGIHTLQETDPLPDGQMPLADEITSCTDRKLAEIALQLLPDLGVECKNVDFIKGFVTSADPLPGSRVDELRAKILAEFSTTVFSGKTTGDPPIRGPLGVAEIILKSNVTPCKQRQFTITGERRDAWIRLIDQLILEGKIEPGHGSWNSPSFPVPKKRPGDYRLVVDFRALNDATEVDAHPLPRIEEILQRQGRFKIWSVLDMKDGYHQVPLKEEHRDLTCMSTPRGTMRWKVLVMGLKNGNAIFQRVMEHVLRNEDCADPYVDDVIIGSTGDTEEELLINHEADLRRVLNTLAEHQLIADPRKAHLFMRQVEFCGHVLKEGKRTPAPGKLLSLQKWEMPKTITALGAFLGLANYYSQYVPKYAYLAGPLMELLKVD
jgi:hypothetical protein